MNASLQIVGSIYALENYMQPEDGMLFKTLGRLEAFDGFSEEYMYKEGDNSVIDNISVVGHKNGGGKFIAFTSSDNTSSANVVRASEYGILGNGSDETALFNSVMGIAAVKKAAVHLEDGKTYIVGAITHTKINFYCQGSATIKAAEGIQTGKAILTGVDIILDGVTVDGDNKVTRCVSVTGTYKQRRSTIKNAVGTSLSFGRLVYATDTCTSFSVDEGCIFSGVTGVENGIEGDTAGADCGIYLNTPLFNINGASFSNIGGYEDGDCIRVQLLADEDLLWASAAGSKITNCKFPSIKKRAIKIQASYVQIYGNEVSSTSVHDTLCPYAAIDVYGSYNDVRANKIDLSRAVAGIIDNGINNTIETNYVDIARLVAYTTARGSAASAIRNENSIGSMVSNNKVRSQTTSSFFINASVGSKHTINKISGNAYASQIGIYVSGGSDNYQQGNEIAGTSAFKLRYGVQVDNSLRNKIISNTFDQVVSAIRYYGSTSSSRNALNICSSTVSSVVDYTGATPASAQTISDSDGSIVASVTSGGIAAGGTYATTIAWPPVAVGSVYVVTPSTGGSPLEDGIIVTVEPTAMATLKLKLINLTSGAITPATRSYKIKLLS
jgi:hypothetical protein